MFESICIHLKNTPGSESLEKAIDFGFIAEAMLFYQEVHIITGSSFLKILVQKFQPDVLLKFLESGFLRISYLENDTGILTEDTRTVWEKHKPILFSNPVHLWEKHSKQLFSEALGHTKKGARRYSIQVSRYIKPLSIGNSITTEILEDFSNGENVENAMVYLLKHFIPDYKFPEPLIFDVTSNKTHFFVETNIDFSQANEYYHKRISPRHSSLSASYLLGNLMGARRDWYYSSRFTSGVATDTTNSIIFSLKFNDLLKVRKHNEEQISVFQNYVFDDARAISEVINNGKRSFRDLFDLISEANKFKHWLKDQQPSEQLFKAYFQEVTKKSWADKLPPKAVRWALFNLAGLGIDALYTGELVNC